MRGEMVYHERESQAIPNALVDYPLDLFFFVRWRTSVRTKQLTLVRWTVLQGSAVQVVQGCPVRAGKGVGIDVCAQRSLLNLSFGLC